MRRKKITTIVATLLAILLLVGLIMPVITMAKAVTQSDIDKLKKELSSLSADKKDIKSRISSLSGKKATQEETRKNIDQELTITEQEIDVLIQLIEELNRDLEEKTIQLNEAAAKVEEQYALLTQRMRATYEAGDLSYLEVLLSSRSYTSFLTNMDVVSNILEYDKNLLEELTATLKQIEEAKAALEAAKADQEATKLELDERQRELEQKRTESDKMISELKANVSAYEAELKKAEKEEQAIQQMINQMMKEMSKTQYVGGTFTWPVPGVTRITDTFGPRIHPVTGRKSTHTGIDIAAPYGKKVVAANGGTVIIAGYNYAYGNYVVIDHGGGYSTLYGHMSKLATKKGAGVDKGQTIGYVGSTGLSTGNHLHFEIRKNGTAINPLNYFKKVG
jgi:murein DD-endopeptidase MepM/ murein hydrolase activator NlpD